MATINPRLLPLIETLIGAGVDWLAIELIAALDHGRWPEESEEVLASTRAEVREGSAQKRVVETIRETVVSSEIPIDEQVNWAASFLFDRLDTAIADLEGSFENLYALMEYEGVGDERLSLKEARPTSIIIGEMDDAARVTAVDVETAKLDMKTLQAALKRWANKGGGEGV